MYLVDGLLVVISLLIFLLFSFIKTGLLHANVLRLQISYFCESCERCCLWKNQEKSSYSW